MSMADQPYFFPPRHRCLCVCVCVLLSTSLAYLVFDAHLFARLVVAAQVMNIYICPLPLHPLSKDHGDGGGLHFDGIQCLFPSRKEATHGSKYGTSTEKNYKDSFRGSETSMGKLYPLRGSKWC